MTDPIARVEAVLAEATSPTRYGMRTVEPKVGDLLIPADQAEAFRLARNLMPEALAVVRAADAVSHYEPDHPDLVFVNLRAALSAFTERVQSALGEEGS